MDKKCKNCIKDDIGCNVIKQLRKDVLKIKVNRSYLHIIALFICALGLFIAGLFAFRTFFPVPPAKNMVFDIKISGEKNISGDAKAEIKKELAEALIEVENRAVAAYNEKFTILLTVLTIFGIAWPLVVAILQLRFNEGELKKIKEAEEKANAANTSVGQFDKKIGSFENRMNNLFEAQINMQNTTQELEALKHNLYDDLQLIYVGLGAVYIALSKQSDQNHKFIPAAMRMYLEQARYFCKFGENIDETINSVFKIYETHKSYIIQHKNEARDFLSNVEWEILKENCSQECSKKLDDIQRAICVNEKEKEK